MGRRKYQLRRRTVDGRDWAGTAGAALFAKRRDSEMMPNHPLTVASFRAEDGTALAKFFVQSVALSGVSRFVERLR
jgi:hypothetical protein